MAERRASATPSVVAGSPRVAVIGAGLAGLVCARTLTDGGLEVVVFDKARGPGGRTSTRRETTSDGATLFFDHGAPALDLPVEPPDPDAAPGAERALAQCVWSWRASGVLAPWSPRVARFSADGGFGSIAGPADLGDDRGFGRLVGGTGGVHALAKHLCGGLGPRGRALWQTRVARIAREAEVWQLSGEAGERLGAFDAVLIAVPAPQAAELLDGWDAPAAAGWASRLRAVTSKPVLAAMVQLAAPVDPGWDEALFEGADLARAVREGSKPGRDDLGAFTLHASEGFTAAHLEDEPAESARRLSLCLRSVLPGRNETVLVRGHRWRYARVEPLGEGAWYDAEAGIGVCGDALLGGDAAGALGSGMALAGRLLDARRGR